MDMLYFFLPAILILGIATSYTDFKCGKIKNRHTLFALIYIPVAYGIMVTYFFFARIPVNVSYLADLGLNMAIALVFGFLAWHFGVWSAADGKLFFAYSGLVPLTVYSRTYFTYFPSFVLLINTFFPVFIYYAIKLVFFTKVKEKGDFFRKIRPCMVLDLLMNVFWISWISRLIVVFVKVDIGFLGNILIMVSIIFFIRRVATLWKISLLLCILRVIFDYSFVFTPNFLWQFISYSIVLILIFFVLMFSSSLFTRAVDIRKLKPGMILSDYIYHERGRYKKMDELEAFEMLEREIIKKRDLLKMGRTGDGLTKKDIEKIRNLSKGKKLDFSNMGVAQMLPFSPFLFLGVILTIIAGGNFLLLAGIFNIL